MNRDETTPDILGETIHELADHKGILGVSADPGKSSLEIAFDPDQVSEQELRELASENSGEVAMELKKLSFRLESSGCEAGALRLEKKVEKIHGVRRATASYLGKVLCLTFDSAMAPEGDVIAGLHETGANIAPLELGKRQEERLPLFTFWGHV